MADRDDVLTRQKNEKKELQGECQRMKHAVPKGDKKRKKEVTEQIAKLEADLEARHIKELQEIESCAKSEVDDAAEALSNLTAAGEGAVEKETAENEDDVSGQSQQSKKPSRAQKRRDKKTAKEKDRDERVKEAAVTNLQGPRHQENLRLTSLLAQRGLRIHQIPSDGNCMYNAIKHQLKKKGIEENNESLRRKTAHMMLSRQDDFLPFVTNLDETGDMLTPEKFEQYCEEVASTTAWGGHLELRALSDALSVPMEVVQAEGPKVNVGEDFSGTPITLVYHRHALGLGEHYNSVEEKKAEDEEDEDFTAS